MVGRLSRLALVISDICLAQLRPASGYCPPSRLLNKEGVPEGTPSRTGRRTEVQLTYQPYSTTTTLATGSRHM